MGKSLLYGSVVLVVLVILMNVISGFAQKREAAVEEGPSKELTRDYESLERQLSGN